jgi:hypothetical protein
MFTLLFFQHFSVPETVTDVCEMVITINEYNTSVVILTFTDSNILCEFWDFCSSEPGASVLGYDGTASISNQIQTFQKEHQGPFTQWYSITSKTNRFFSNVFQIVFYEQFPYSHEIVPWLPCCLPCTKTFVSRCCGKFIKLRQYIQGVPGGMCQASGGCSLC